MRLKEIHWQKNAIKPLEDLATWGIHPLKEFVDIMGEALDEIKMDLDEERRTTIILAEMQNKLEETEEAIYRFIDERQKKPNKDTEYRKEG